jgi:hypothetical protein
MISVRAGLLVLLLSGVVATTMAAIRPLVDAAVPSARSRGEVPTNPGGAKLEKAVIRAALSRPMFRADRQRSATPYDGTEMSAPEIPVPASVPKPLLAVSGIVVGPEPAVLLEGLPGLERSVVLRKGDSAQGVRVVRIEHERVFLAGFDTTWTLTVRNPWR